MKTVNSLTIPKATVQANEHSRSLALVSVAVLATGATVSFWKIRRLSKNKAIELKYKHLNLS